MPQFRFWSYSLSHSAGQTAIPSHITRSHEFFIELQKLEKQLRINDYQGFERYEKHKRLVREATNICRDRILRLGNEGASREGEAMIISSISRAVWRQAMDLLPLQPRDPQVEPQKLWLQSPAGGLVPLVMTCHTPWRPAPCHSARCLVSADGSHASG